LNRNGAIALCGVLAWAAIPAMGETAPALEPATLSVHGSASIRVPADKLDMDIEVETRNTTAEAALADNAKRVKAVIQALANAGVPEDAIKTDDFSIEPEYEREPDNPPADWYPEAVAFTVTNSVSLTTKKLELAPKLIVAAASSGATELDVYFGLEDVAKVRGEAIGLAVRHAKREAETLASAAGLRLQRLESIELDDAGSWVGRRRIASGGGSLFSSADDDAEPVIRETDVSIEAEVDVTYEVSPG
jgi:uncharacterized protein